MADSKIVAMGGGGFSEELNNPLLDDYILTLTGKEDPKVCFVATAAGDAAAYIVKFYAAFAKKHLPPYTPCSLARHAETAREVRFRARCHICRRRQHRDDACLMAVVGS